ncbi:nucleoside/nucleotide kinase family protein [Schumannella sp. 10F1B-5-1]|uniref:nucleoside/nucleotide kinase family protein n=1 Tax=Schumannella sp. 10F1B-5-1 TaxID=2590780 RepID=UPI001130F9FF|nr:nucleoside/nucleotide kinase family protein [Schumannella sp. 10F1B-5-1]TPW71730.1 nucleoside/nucleotide kinase family protein [Schumannella sp. 10F1B-5-1]
MPPSDVAAPRIPGLGALADRALALSATRASGGDGGRVVIGIAGSPGAGKTTLAKALVALLNQRAGVADGSAADPGAIAGYLPLDGFHLANSTLDRLGIHDRKGAIDTFDGWGFVGLLHRVRRESDHTVYAPGFSRDVDEGVAGEIAIEPQHRIVIVEGNYLLDDADPWERVRDLLDEAWFCAAPDDARVERLVDRHTRHGRSVEAATAWAHDVDGVNAERIERSSSRAVLRVSGLDGRVLDPMD